MRQKQGKIEYRCSFCGKLQAAVRRFIAGPNGVYICNECVALCQEIISEEQAWSARPASPDAGGGAVSPSSEHGESDEHTEALRPATTPMAMGIDAARYASLAPLVAELAAARATIERLARENGALRERLGTP